MSASRLGGPATAGRPEQKDPARISAMFDAIAPRYDLLNRCLSAGLDRRWRARAIRALELENGETVLDLCTGTADLALAAVDLGERQIEVVGIDFASEMLRLAQAKLRRREGTPIRLVRGDALRLPLPDGAVDAVTIGFGIRNVQDSLAACREIRRVLRPGGRVAILEFGMPQVPGVRQLYGWYFRRLVPAVGQLISRHREAYSYLPASVGSFLSPQAFSEQLRQAGFVDVVASPLALGVVFLHVGHVEAAELL